MKKGLTITLMTVAIAIIGMRAMALAPVISDIPSPIVGNENSVTFPNLFVYPDAIDLRNYVTDDTTTDAANIIWSYTIASPKYTINGVPTINPASENVLTAGASGAKRINNQVLNGEVNPDSNPNTITIRNSNLSPLSGTAGTANGTGILTGETQVLTLFASDGTTYSSRSDIFLYTDRGGSDRLSGATGVEVYHADFTGNTDSWTYYTVLGTVTSGTSSGTAICLGASLTGLNFAGWSSPYGILPMTANSVYDIRVSMVGSQASAGTTPFWDIVIDNFSMDASKGMNLYGADCFILDNQGGNSAVTTTSKDFHVFYAPSPVSTAQWNDATNGLFVASKAANKDGRLQFRILDLDNNAGITASSDLGTLCMTDLTINKIPMNAMKTVQAGVYNVTSFTDANGSGGGNTTVDALVGTTVSFAGGVIALTPQTAGQAAEIISIVPGDRNNNFSTPSTQTDNYPVAWAANTLYQVTVDLSAPDANSVTNGPDVFWLGADTPTNEVIYESFVTNLSGQCGMPRTGTAQTYMAFYNGGFGSSTGTPQWKFLRPKMTIGNNGNLVQGNNTGGMKVHSMKVNKVSFN